MYVKVNRSGYDRQDQQVANGEFLIICTNPVKDTSQTELRACVRKVKLQQCGHWMMGSVRLADHRIVLSGAYGFDGLPLSLDKEDIPSKVSQHIWDNMTPVPEDLTKQFWEGGGHNSVGSEGPAMREWALQNLKELKKPIKHINNYL